MRKLLPVARIRILKMFGMVINQVVGYLFLGWNGKENRLYDRSGQLIDDLYLTLYGVPLEVSGVKKFVHRRMYYSFITSICTIFQIIATAYEQIEVGIVISVLLVPMTFIDRQWATSVTKSPPRFQREVLRHRLVTPLCHVLDILPVPRIRMHCNPLINVTNFEILVGVVQFWSGVVLFVLPVALLAAHDATTNLIQSHTVLSAFWFLNVIRIVKEVTNWLSPLIERYLTPLKYEVNVTFVTDFLNKIEERYGDDVALRTALESKASLDSDHYAFFYIEMRKLFPRGADGSVVVALGENGEGLPHFLKFPTLPERHQALLRVILLQLEDTPRKITSPEAIIMESQEEMVVKAATTAQATDPHAVDPTPVSHPGATS